MKIDEVGVPAPGKTVRVNLALQGGGAHGAFTWGVLDRLLEEEWIEIEGISGTSAGAMNAAVLCHGYAKGGRGEARKLLEAFWCSIGSFAATSPVRRTIWDRITGNYNLDASPGAAISDFLHAAVSPYQSNVLRLNPLKDLLESMIDGDTLRSGPIKLFVSATNVATGRVRVFDNKDVSVASVLASACLPTLFHAVEIDGESYWDGGYSGNPALFPLIYGCDCSDVMVVQINPLVRRKQPRTAAEILNRMNEISFNSPLIGEMRAIRFVEKLLESGHVSGKDARHYRRLRWHRCEAEAEMREFGVTSKMNIEMDFLDLLKQLGRRSMSGWLDRHRGDLGCRSSLDIGETYL